MTEESRKQSRTSQVSPALFVVIASAAVLACSGGRNGGARLDANGVDGTVDGEPNTTAIDGSAGDGGIDGTVDGAMSPGSEGYEVLVDPYGHNPLAAVVNLLGITASEVQAVGVVVSGQGGSVDFQKNYSAEAIDRFGFHAAGLPFLQAGYPVPVVGLYANRSNEVRISLDLLAGGRADWVLAIETRMAKPGESVWTPTIRVNAVDANRMEPGWTVAELNMESTSSNWSRPIAFDEQGAIRWAMRLDLPWRETNAFFRTSAGTLLTGSVDTIVEVDMLGRLLRTVPISGYWFHHEILQLPGGNVLVAASKDDTATIEDRVLDVDYTSGKLAQEWDMARVLDPTRTVFVDTQGVAALPGDWIHINGLAYSEADDALIVSGRHQGVAKVDRAGNLIWLLSPHRGWKAPQSDRLLTAIDATGAPYPSNVQTGRAAAADGSFDWPFGQHAPVLLPNGDLLLFDNGANRHFTGGCASSRAVIYRVDAASLTVRQVGQFALDTSVSSCYVSNASQLQVTGNVLIQPGGLQKAPGFAAVREVSTEVASDGTVAFGTVVFDATVDMSMVKTGTTYSYRGHRWRF